MTHTAKVFKSGNSQAVRLPKEFQVGEEEVFIQRVGNSIILTPKSDPWRAFRESLSEFSEDFMADGRNQPTEPERDMTDVFN
jgi:antitoxin VapB